jgi:hypothetical protein
VSIEDSSSSTVLIHPCDMQCGRSELIILVFLQIKIPIELVLGSP